MFRNCFFCAVCVLLIYSVHSEKCRDVHVSNDIAQLERALRNCSIVAGNLKIVLMENVNATEFDRVSFPELTEVQGYFLLYRVYKLTSLGKLFPNLSVIRGRNVFIDYALVIYDMVNLQEIGLYNLKYIERGSVRIDKSPHLCYVKTLSWLRILQPLHALHYFDTNDRPCKKCPPRCNGHCWNQDHCQAEHSNKCHEQCIGCSGKRDDQCHTCKYYKDGKRCVPECPKGKYRHSLLPLCVTQKECPEVLTGKWFVFHEECRELCPSGYKNVSKEKGWCEHCGDRCPKKCAGAEVNSIATAEQLRGCVHINGELTIRVNSKATAAEMEENLGMIEVIDGFLRIYRSQLTTLEFLTNLKEIRGEQLYNNKYALVVYENPNLHTLWKWDMFKIKIKNGTLMFHYNSQLCMSEIETLKNLTGLNPDDHDVSLYSNGNKKACNYIDLNVTVDELTSTSVKLVWDNFTLTSNKSLFIGYVVYYAEDTFMNMTVYNERDECENSWNIVLVSDNSLEIENLNPYTNYTYYIKTYVTLTSLAAQTKLSYFKTLPDEPSGPTHLETISNSSSSIILTWKPSEFPNGVLSHYELVIYYIKDDPKFVQRRNYCIHPHHIHVEEITKPPVEVLPNVTNNATCNCQEEPKISSKVFDTSCDSFDIVVVKSNVRSTGCKWLAYNVDGNDNPKFINDNISIVFEESKRYNLVKRSADFADIMEQSINGSNITSYEIKGLKHFSMYVILLKACNKKSVCSGTESVSQRTLSKDEADDIPSGLSVKVENNDAIIKWPEPKDPNGLIVAYDVAYKRIDLEHSKAAIECIAQQHYASFGTVQYRMRNFLPGHYSVSVKAVSLAGPGKFTEIVEFEITLPSRNVLIGFIITFIIILLLVPVFVYLYHRYKKRNSLDQLRLLSNINYNTTGSDYMEDEWEIDRADVEILKELGQGTFGMVCNGLIKSQNRPCAIKTISDQATVHERSDFLNEASIMKSFSDAHHVVKLLGVVSRGQPPLVVMELMARGDLKSFLRQSRSSSSSNVTCAEMYRMAAEIADGMLYLAVKKFVHCDLAARNCMVSADHTVKIGDFGMTRDIYATDYYRKEAGGLMPIRWMSPESLSDGVFTSDSDVWSYGVVLWEIVTLAEQPYQGLANEQVFQFVTAQGTLERPSECPDLLYEIMEACWKWKPNQRPVFQDIVEKLELHIGQHFRLVSFYHSNEGEEYRINPRDRVYNPPALSMSFNRDTAVYWDAMNDDFSL